VTIDDGVPGDIEIDFDLRDQDKLPSLAESFMETVSIELLSTLKQGWQDHAAEEKEISDGFRNRIEERWRAGLDGLRLLVTIASEFGSNVAHGTAEPGRIAYSMATVRMLHARSCQITEEIIRLLSRLSASDRRRICSGALFG